MKDRRSHPPVYEDISHKMTGNEGLKMMIFGGLKSVYFTFGYYMGIVNHI